MTQPNSNARGIFPAEELSTLGALADPSEFTSSLNLDGWSAEELLENLRLMVLIRTVEDEIGKRVLNGTVKCPCHLVIGQEAIAPGISRHLNAKDKVFGGHRSHAHYLAMGGSLDGLTAEVLGKVTGCSKGMGGSMHLYAPEQGFMGSVPIVGATVPIAVGAALALKKDGGDSVAVSYFGDGTCEEGVVHESLNLASNFNAPVLFVCENNLYSSHMDINWRQPSDNVSRFAVAHKIPSLVVDGNDITAVADATEMLLEQTRKHEAPAFLEVVTYRHRGHVGPDENIDVGIRRSEKDLKAWKERCPIKRLRETLIEASLLNEEDFAGLEKDVRNEVNESFARALEAPYPEDEALIDAVFV